MGIRAALGATPRRLRASIVASALGPVLIGLVTGICCVLLSGRYLRPFVYAIEPTDASTLALVAATFIALAWTASYLPAVRAARVDPLIALRAE
jgi:putative ABC transport system permease protein